MIMASSPCTKITASPTGTPVELLYAIFAALDRTSPEYKPTLASCTLVSKHWSAPAQASLFATVSVDCKDKTVQRFADFLTLAPGRRLGHYVRHLELGSLRLLSTLAAIMLSLPALCSLSLDADFTDDDPLFPDDWTPRPLDLLALKVPANCHTDVHVWLAFFGMFSRVQTLRVHAGYWDGQLRRRVSSFDQPGWLPSLPSLEVSHLDIDDNSNTLIPVLLTNSPSAHTLQSISLDAYRPLSPAMIQLMQGATGLRHVRVDMKYPGQTMFDLLCKLDIKKFVVRHLSPFSQITSLEVLMRLKADSQRLNILAVNGLFSRNCALLSLQRITVVMDMTSSIYGPCDMSERKKKHLTQTLPHMPWQCFEEQLAASHYLEDLRFVVVLSATELEPWEECFESIRSRLPILDEKGVLRFEMGQPKREWQRWWEDYEYARSLEHLAL
ncbi:hypothetical protein EIP91_004129 [Steccherinum ochraceum]|uniref:F-box domain-containing protein n=1 Tax=Steccherinum ochraceum TaxID=92696 RepID=A0A4R0RAD4_9APHY|nr:hypothetical protein EIP91_004129 [Steccherinum ochraceum]